MHNALNNKNMMCAQILRIKLRYKNSSFADNYRFLSYKYNLTNSDWINAKGSLLAKEYLVNITVTIHICYVLY